MEKPTFVIVSSDKENRDDALAAGADYFFTDNDILYFMLTLQRKIIALVNGDVNVLRPETSWLSLRNTVLPYLTAEEALEEISSTKHPVNIVISRDVLPGKSGIILIRELREQYKPR